MLVRSIREVRQAKIREGLGTLEGGGVVSLRGVSGLEVSEERGFMVGVMDGLREIGANREWLRRKEEVAGGGAASARARTATQGVDEDDDIEMSLEPSTGY